MSAHAIAFGIIVFYLNGIWLNSVYGNSRPKEPYISRKEIEKKLADIKAKDRLWQEGVNMQFGASWQWGIGGLSGWDGKPALSKAEAARRRVIDRQFAARAVLLRKGIRQWIRFGVFLFICFVVVPLAVPLIHLLRFGSF